MTLPVKYEDTPSAKTGFEHRQKTQQVLPMKKEFM
jgi:hypothetical protein